MNKNNKPKTPNKCQKCEHYDKKNKSCLKKHSCFTEFEKCGDYVVSDKLINF